MPGKVRRKLIEHYLIDQSTSYIFNSPLICPLCAREIPTAQRDAHHLIPKCKGGRETQFLHRICHRQIHALFTEVELANNYHHIEQLLMHPEIISFVNWIKTKPGSFIERSRKSTRIRVK